MKEYDRELKKNTYEEAKREAYNKGKKMTQEDLQTYVFYDEKEEENMDYSQ
ncbi:MAG: hypothetical protein LBS02_02195 [Hungatella sp.]|jgi:hypothetical protein|nr:hypothetical protein [Hungatella sp.]